jgi:hypothetical protein
MKLSHFFILIIAIILNSCVGNSDTQDVQEYIKNMREDKARRAENFEKNKHKYSPEAIAYFDEIAMSTEDGKRYNNVTRYTTDVKIYMEGHKPQYIVDELNRIVSELNDIIKSVNIVVVNNKDDANMIVSIGSMKRLREVYTVFKQDRYSNCNASFAVGTNSSTIILNTDNIKTVDQAKHVLREEITQAMGLFNDSYKYPESIFYQGLNLSTEYAPIDRELIDILYNN